MAAIHVLSQDTINKIAAGEVIERPMAVVKELIENAIDAGAAAITIEISDGGKELIRITDNGSGIGKEDIVLAFTPHATSKISTMTDLLTVSSLGFRGEALASIAAVSRLEMITKTKEDMIGYRYLIDGGEEKSLESIGCPEGTTFIVRNLFYNTPARLKFLKTAQTEAGYIGSLIERMALSHPEISFRYLQQKQQKISTSGNGNLKDVIYHIYGRDITANLIETDRKEVFCEIGGFIAKPVVSRGNRAMMNYFINGRYIKSPVIQKAIEDAYAPYTMQHRYPFTALHFKISPEYIDVNVHPQKMEIRFHNEREIYQSVYHGISEALKYREYIPEITFRTKEEEKSEKEQKQVLAKERDLEPFETGKREEQISSEKKSSYTEQPPVKLEPAETVRESGDYLFERTGRELRELSMSREEEAGEEKAGEEKQESAPAEQAVLTGKQQELFEEEFLNEKLQKEVQIIGQVFSTYWILQYENKMYLIDQHAAHEKVLYERFMKKLHEGGITTQMLNPPIILSLSMGQKQAVEEHMDLFTGLGFLIESFGGREYAVSGVPAHLPNIGTEDLLLEVIDAVTEDRGMKKNPDILTERVATMSCKAAVKGNNTLSIQEVEELLRELMTLENPYHCPHGRPTMISVTKTELEKRFKRIL